MVAARNDLDALQVKAQEDDASSPLRWPSFNPSDRRHNPDLTDLRSGGRRVPRDDARNLLADVHAQEQHAASGQAASKAAVPLTPITPGKQRQSGKNRRRNWKLLAGAAAVTLPVAGVIGGAILLSNLFELPDLTQSIEQGMTTRMERQAGDFLMRQAQQAMDTQTTTTEGKTFAEVFADRYAGEKPLVSRLNKLILRNIAKNLHIGDNLTFNSEVVTDSSGKVVSNTLKSLTYGEHDIPIPEPSLNPFQFFKAIEFSAQVNTAMREELGANGMNGFANILRAQTISATVRQETNIGLVAWTLGWLKSLGQKTASESPPQALQDAELAVNQQEAEQVTDNFARPDGSSVIPEADQAIKDSNGDIQQVVENGGSDLGAAMKNNGVPDAATKAVAQDFTTPGWQQVVGSVSATTAVLNYAMLACTIYEGSVEHSGPTINTNTQDEMRAFFWLGSVTSEMEAGGPPGADTTGVRNAVAAAYAKVGNTNTSNALIRANGGAPDTLATSASAEAAPLQEYTLINSFLGNSASGQTMAAFVNHVATDNTCAALTNPYTNVASLAVQLAILILTLGGSGAAEAGGDVATETAADATLAPAADEVTSEVSSNLVSRFAAGVAQKVATQGIGTTITRIGLWVGKQFVLGVAAPMGVTDLAKLFVMYRASGLMDGLEQNANFVNEADAGANAWSGEMSRQEGGRPLTNAEVAQADTADHTYIAEVNSQQSFTDRYFAVTNANSLLMRSATMIASSTTALIGPSGNLANLFLAPARAVGYIFGQMSGRAWAAADPSTEYYGNIQFGFSRDEEQLLNSDSSYTPLENQRTLDQSGKLDEIAQKYAACFGYSYNASGTGFDPTASNSKLQSDIGSGDGSIGSLESSGNVTRTDNSDLQTNDESYLCSPQNLGVNNPTYGNLVFRFRAMLADSAALTQLDNLQTVSN